jgi:D-alanine-D-alanine ligase
VNLSNYKEIIEKIVDERSAGKVTPVVFNICDGDEINGTPGISVVRLLEEKELIYTGIRRRLLQDHDSKIPMKEAFNRAGVPTASWKAIYDKDLDHENFFEKLGNPIIVKPSVSGGSMGVGIKNVVP